MRTNPQRVIHSSCLRHLFLDGMNYILEVLNFLHQLWRSLDDELSLDT